MRYITIILFPALFVLAACSGSSRPQAKENSDAPITVTLATASASSPEGVTASGQLEAIQTAAISSRIMGAITHIYAKAGDKVTKGQILATISSPDLLAKKAQADAAVAAATADLTNAQKDYDRFTNLYNKQSATASEMDNATLRYNASKSKLEAARQLRNEVDASINYTRLTAPFTGVVTQKMTDEGSMASPGMPLLIIEQKGLLQASILIAESDISRIQKGDKAIIDIKATSNKTEGYITEISPSSVLTGGQYLAKVSVPATIQKDLYTGMYVNVFIPSRHAISPASPGQAVLVPLSALVHNDQLTGLYTISSAHTALLRWIRTGRTWGDKIEVLSGLSQNEPFILHADGRLYNGAPVQQQ